jgi:hypothetical protein
MQVTCKKIPKKLGTKLKAVVKINIPYDESLFAESNQHGEAFLRTMKLIQADDRIEKVEILIADTLQAHNLKAIYGFDAQVAEQKAEKLGAYWYKKNIEDNRLFFENFGKAVEVKFWNEYKKHQDFTSAHSKLDDLYSSEKPNGFYQKTRSQAGSAANKIMKRVEQSDEIVTCIRDDVLEGSIALLKEESVVRVILGSYFQIEYYPDKLDSVMGTACEKFSDAKPYRVAVTIRKEQENSHKISQTKVKHHEFYDRSLSYPPSSFSVSNDTLLEHPLLNAVISGMLNVVDVNDDPIVHQIFLMGYTQFISDFLKQKIAGQKSKLIVPMPSEDNTAISADESLDKEIIGVDSEQQEGKGNQFQLGL